MNDSTILSFLHTIHPAYMPCYKTISPYKIKVTYKLFWNGKVEILQYGLHPDVLGKVQNWEKLKDEIQAASEDDSKKYLRPGQYRGRAEMPQPGEDPYHDAKLETNWK